MPKKSELKKKTEEKKKEIVSKKISAPEFEKMILELSEKGLTSEKIGETLRKQGIHSKEHGKKISKILKEKGKYENPDMKNIRTKLEKILKHIEKNKQDKRAMREKDRIFAQLRILKKHFQVQ
ncbi:hypothetical protein HYT25_01430 [Candidatus Pacearchaeota archaeon]|nr:hypothetical protein [Candidatus Pacearchaeota archaeon]